MSEIKSYKGDKGMSESSETATQIIQKLEGNGAVHFGYIRQQLETCTLSPGEKEALAQAAVSKVQDTVKGGHWGDLRGAKELLSFLGIDTLNFSDEWTERVEDFYKRFSRDFLVSLSPMLRNGKIADGRDYDRNQYTRERLIAMGVSESEATDEFINSLWDVREVLIAMHVRRINLDDKNALTQVLMLKNE